MVSKSIPKLLQEANEVKLALEKIGAGVPAGISVAEMMNRIAALVDAVNAVDALNAERTRLVNNKADQAKNLSDYIVQVRAAVKGILGADSSEYDMVGGTRASGKGRSGRRAGRSKNESGAINAQMAKIGQGDSFILSLTYWPLIGGDYIRSVS